MLLFTVRSDASLQGVGAVTTIEHRSLSLDMAAGVVFPPMPAFYLGLQSLEEAETQMVGRILDPFGVPVPVVKRWKVTGPPSDATPSQR